MRLTAASPPIRTGRSLRVSVRPTGISNFNSGIALVGLGAAGVTIPHPTRERGGTVDDPILGVFRRDNADCQRSTLFSRLRLW